MKFLQISDIHLSCEGVLGFDTIEHFNACLDHAEQNHPDADLVAITGDLTHRGDPDAYTVLRDRLWASPFRPLLLIGNHDLRDAFQTAFPDVPKNTDGFVQYCVDTQEGRFLCLDTVATGTHAGRFCDKRQAWLRAELVRAQSDNVACFLLMHHNPVPVGVRSSDAIGLLDGAALREILSDFRSVIRHIFFGHCHFILSGSVCGIPFAAPRSTAHCCVPVFDGREDLGFAAMAPTYNLCLIDANAIVVHTIDYTFDGPVDWRQSSLPSWGGSSETA